MVRASLLLIACAVCIAQSASTDEKSLTKFSTAQLLKCFKSLKPCYADPWSIADELASRGILATLTAEYWRTKDPAIRAGIEKVAYRSDSQESQEFMTRVISEKRNDGEALYYPLNYLAKRCQEAGLKALATGAYRSQGSLQYAASVELFGTCNYRPGIPYLVDDALSDASLNIVIAAQNSLRKLYPGSPTEFSDPIAAQRFYCQKALADNFPVHCK